MVDYVFTSPPYNDDGKTDGSHKKYKEVEYRKDWYEWQVECINQMIRISKNMVFYNIQAIQSNKQDVYKLIGHFANKIHIILIWYKPNAQPQNIDNRIGNNYEMVIVFKCKEFKSLHCNDKNYNSVIVQNSNSDRRFVNVHHAIMSQDFANEIIREFTQKGETILDPFSGLATTGIACVNQHRNYIGIEKDKEYYELSKQRISTDTSQFSLFDMGFENYAKKEKAI